jgi:dihydroorotase
MAEFGIISLQTVFPILNQFEKQIGFSKLLQKITTNPRRILNLPQPTIKPGQTANLTIFDSTNEWFFNDTTNRSKSKNSPFYGQKLKGKVLSVFNNNKYWIDEALIYQK